MNHLFELHVLSIYLQVSIQTCRKMATKNRIQTFTYERYIKRMYMSIFCLKEKRYSWSYSSAKSLEYKICCSLWWRHNEHDGVYNHQPYHCLPNRLFRRRSKKTLNVWVTGLCAGNSPVTGELSAQMASNAENVSIWWRNHVYKIWLTKILCQVSSEKVYIYETGLRLIWAYSTCICFSMKSQWTIPTDSVSRH